MTQPVPGPDAPGSIPPWQGDIETHSVPVELHRSMRAGPVVAGAAVALLAVGAIASAVLGGGPTRTAVPAAPASTTTPTATPSPTPTEASPTGLLTIAPATSITTSASPSSTPTLSTTTTTTTVTRTPTPTPPTTGFPDVPAPAGAQECARSGVGPFAAVGTGNATTTCGFAVNVWSTYLKLGIYGSTVHVRAWSPSTGLTYTLTCTGSQPVVCSGGNNGLVLLYGGRLVVG